MIYDGLQRFLSIIAAPPGILQCCCCFLKDIYFYMLHHNLMCKACTCKKNCEGISITRQLIKNQHTHTSLEFPPCFFSSFSFFILIQVIYEWKINTHTTVTKGKNENKIIKNYVVVCVFVCSFNSSLFFGEFLFII